MPNCSKRLLILLLLLLVTSVCKDLITLLGTSPNIIWNLKNFLCGAPTSSFWKARDDGMYSLDKGSISFCSSSCLQFLGHFLSIYQMYTDNVAAWQAARISIDFMWATLSGNLRKYSMTSMKDVSSRNVASFSRYSTSYFLYFHDHYSQKIRELVLINNHPSFTETGAKTKSLDVSSIHKTQGLPS